MLCWTATKPDAVALGQVAALLRRCRRSRPSSELPRRPLGAPQARLVGPAELCRRQSDQRRGDEAQLGLPQSRRHRHRQSPGRAGQGAGTCGSPPDRDGEGGGQGGRGVRQGGPRSRRRSRRSGQERRHSLSARYFTIWATACRRTAKPSREPRIRIGMLSLSTSTGGCGSFCGKAIRSSPWTPRRRSWSETSRTEDWNGGLSAPRRAAESPAGGVWVGDTILRRSADAASDTRSGWEQFQKLSEEGQAGDNIGLNLRAGPDATAGATSGKTLELPPSETWGHAETLEDHFLRHGSDFSAGSSEDYANEASQFLQGSQLNGLPTKIDPLTGVIRVYDPVTNRFGAYNANGTTRTFYRPDPAIHGYPTNTDYWNVQPGIAPWTP